MASDSARHDGAEMAEVSNGTSAALITPQNQTQATVTGGRSTERAAGSTSVQEQTQLRSEERDAMSQTIVTSGSQDVVNEAVRGAGHGPGDVETGDYTSVQAKQATQEGSTPSTGMHDPAVTSAGGTEEQSSASQRNPADGRSSEPVAALSNSQGKTSNPDDVTLDLLLLSGSRKRFTFKQSTTINEVLAWIYKDWPSEWAEEKPQELAQLRLLHRGQFLQGPAQLSSRNLEPGDITVMHLNIKPADTAEPLKPKRTRSPTRKGPAATSPESHGGGCCSGCVVA